jgi:hypothetical protein
MPTFYQNYLAITEVQTTKPEVPGSSSGSGSSFCDERPPVRAVYIYYYQYRLYMYDLCMLIRYLVSISQVRKDTKFGLGNWYDCGNYLFFILLGISRFLLWWNSEGRNPGSDGDCTKLFISLVYCLLCNIMAYLNLVLVTPFDPHLVLLFRSMDGFYERAVARGHNSASRSRYIWM